MKNMHLKAALLFLAGAAFCTLASGFTFIYSDGQLPVKWTPDKSSIAIQILADNSTHLMDGSTQATAIQAAMTDPTIGWNHYLGDVQFAPQIAAAGQGADGNKINEIFFSSKPYTYSWDTNTLALTTTWLSGSQRGEADIIFNTQYTWDSYRGALLASGVLDLRRVALHELGHVLGLDHPDQATPPQIISPTPIMNSIISNTDALTADDITGATSLYGTAPLGHAPANDNFVNAVAITLSGTSARVTGTNVNATREANEPIPDSSSGGSMGGHSVWWKWTAPADGSVSLDTQGSLFDTTLGVYTGTAVSGLTNVAYNDDIEKGAIQNSSLTFNASNGVTYFFAVDGFNGNDGNGSDSAAITLNLNFAVTGGSAPVITSQPRNEVVTPDGSVTFSVTATGAALSYQWSLDGSPLSGATSSSLTVSVVVTTTIIAGNYSGPVNNAQSANAGNYTVTVSNSFGSVTSNPVKLTLLDNPLPNETVTTAHNGSLSAFGVGGSFQWQVSTDGGKTWTNLDNNSTYSGVTSRFLQITAVTPALNGYQYRYVVTSSGNSSTSNASTLTVSAAVLPFPACITINSAGTLIVGDGSNNNIQTVSTAGFVTPLAGSSGQAGSTDGKGTGALFNQPGGIVAANDGNVYVADTANGTIRSVAPDGTVTTIAGKTSVRGNADGTGSAASFSSPTGIAVSGNILYVADAVNNTIRQVTTAGVVTTFAGGGGTGQTISGTSDGTGTAARFNHPSGIAIDGTGNLYVSDSTNNTIRLITPAGVVSTFAGVAGVNGDQNGTGSGALFNNPQGLAVDSSNNLYVADTGNSCIRRISPAGVVINFAGLPTIAGLEDGFNIYAFFNQPRSLVVDSLGNVYVADTGNAALRQITPGYMVTTLALSQAQSSTGSTGTTGGTGSAGSTAGGSGSNTSTPSGGGGGGAPSIWFITVLTLLGFGRLLRVRR